MMGQNLSFKLEAVGKNSLKTVHANRTVNWTTPNERYICISTNLKRNYYIEGLYFPQDGSLDTSL